VFREDSLDRTIVKCK